MKKIFLKIHIVLLTVLININVLYRLIGYIVDFLYANNICNLYNCQNNSLNSILNLLYNEEKSIIFVFISAFSFIAFSFLSLLLYGITTKKERAVYAVCALIPFIIPQFIPYEIPLWIWNVLFVFGIIALTVYFIYLIYFCISIIKKSS